MKTSLLRRASDTWRMRIGGEAFEHYPGNSLLNAFLATSHARRVLDSRKAVRHVISNETILPMHNQLTWRRISSNGSRFLDGCFLGREETARFASRPFYGPPGIGAIYMNGYSHLNSAFIIEELPVSS
jgi:hypothetical protein